MWGLAPAVPFTLEDAKAAIDEGTDRLDDGFYRARSRSFFVITSSVCGQAGQGTLSGNPRSTQ